VLSLILLQYTCSAQISKWSRRSAVRNYKLENGVKTKEQKERFKQYKAKSKESYKKSIATYKRKKAGGVPYYYKIEYKGKEGRIIEDAYLEVYSKSKNA